MTRFDRADVTLTSIDLTKFESAGGGGRLPSEAASCRVVLENELKFAASLHRGSTCLRGLVILQRRRAAHADRADDFAADNNRHPSGSGYHTR